MVPNFELCSKGHRRHGKMLLLNVTVLVVHSTSTEQESKSALEISFYLSYQATEPTEAAWPISVDIHWPVVRSQIFTVLSLEPDAIQAASDDQATNRTQSEWPFNVDTH